MRKLIIGSGPGYQHIEGQIALDYIAAFNPDVVRDIKRGLPFDSEKFDEVEAFHILEHIESNADFLFVMNEIHRVLKKGGIFRLTVPHYQSSSAIDVYEHCRLFNENSFVNFYSNPYAKEMGIELYELVDKGVRDKDGGQEVFVTMGKL